ncbi:hypothetical protein ACGFOM_18175 [Streptomyces sp. NPDC048594]|uniref:hypothetical protein n=1 Tax=Streptomyces sp. NPDC048594 TaxID=3365575 RepID=UPI00371EE641
MTYEPESTPPELLGSDAFGRPVYGHPLKAVQRPQAPVYGPAVPAPVQRAQGLSLGRVAVFAGATVAVSLALAVSLVAVAVSVVSLTVCVLVLRSVWRDVQKGR